MLLPVQRHHPGFTQQGIQASITEITPPVGYKRNCNTFDSSSKCIHIKNKQKPCSALKEIKMCSPKSCVFVLLLLDRFVFFTHFLLEGAKFPGKRVNQL